MKNLLFGLIALISFSACGTMSNEPTTDQVIEERSDQQELIAQDVDVKEFQARIEKNPGLILDVRTPQEYNAGHLAGCQLIDFYSADFSQQLDKLDKSRPIYVYCKVGGRSGKTMSMLNDKGFSEVYNLDGGFDAWAAANMPVEK